jgi:protocatechuate 3,4-dioxygenase beta subunit
VEKRLTRRTSLVALGGLAAAAAGWRAEDAGAGPAAVASGAVACVLTPEMTEGPYYVPGEAVRRNITEGLPGTPLALRLTVVNASTCKPIAGAKVDIWHASGTGVYSGVQGNTETFMRGIQPTNAHGLARFDTVYPGWYTGRTVHVHVKVHLGGNVVHTGQLCFPDTLTDRVYRKAPYNTRPGRDTRNATDAIFRNSGSRSLLTIERSGSGYVGSILLGVHRS